VAETSPSQAPHTGLRERYEQSRSLARRVRGRGRRASGGAFNHRAHYVAGKLDVPSERRRALAIGDAPVDLVLECGEQKLDERRGHALSFVASALAAGSNRARTASQRPAAAERVGADRCDARRSEKGDARRLRLDGYQPFQAKHPVTYSPTRAPLRGRVRGCSGRHTKDYVPKRPAALEATGSACRSRLAARVSARWRRGGGATVAVGPQEGGAWSPSDDRSLSGRADRRRRCRAPGADGGSSGALLGRMYGDLDRLEALASVAAYVPDD